MFFFHCWLLYHCASKKTIAFHWCLCSFYVVSQRWLWPSLSFSRCVHAQGGSRLSTSECNHGVMRYIYLQITQWRQPLCRIAVVLVVLLLVLAREPVVHTYGLMFTVHRSGFSCSPYGYLKLSWVQYGLPVFSLLQSIFICLLPFLCRWAVLSRSSGRFCAQSTNTLLSVRSLWWRLPQPRPALDAHCVELSVPLVSSIFPVCYDLDTWRH